MLLLDIDEFKNVNDRYGHIAGDNTLIGLVEILNDITRSGDLVSRFGGEEFVLLLAETAQDEAFARLDEARSAFEQFRIDGMTSGSTISVGIAEYPTHSRDYEELIGMADKAMYAAKQAGGNRIAFFDPHSLT